MDSPLSPLLLSALPAAVRPCKRVRERLPKMARNLESHGASGHGRAAPGGVPMGGTEGALAQTTAPFALRGCSPPARGCDL